MKDALDDLKITLVEESRLPQVDLLHLTFGTVFSDHMFIADYIDGRWQTPEIRPYGPIELYPGAKVFHYGQAVFEGMKAFKDEEGRVFLFRPDKNFERINRSAWRLAMPPIPEEFFMGGIKKLIELDKDWIPDGEGASLYIRPVYIAIDNQIAANASRNYRFMIMTSPAQKYFSGEVKVKIEQHYSRACAGGVGFAKAAGNYAAQFMPTMEAAKEGYTQLIWTDSKTHQLVEESGAMNVFFRIGDEICTPELTDSILPGVTRDSLLTLGRDQGLNMVERKITVDELVDAAESGELKEIFGAGTAVTVLPIKGFGYKDKYYPMPELDNPIAGILKQMLLDIQYNRAPDPYGWRVRVL
ncbi:MAG: branched-chain amino acid aminotransferase [Chlorobi bacterium]|nr:branched-chain amino acid aminotransferase [Chlorobiota bacterium]